VISRVPLMPEQMEILVWCPEVPLTPKPERPLEQPLLANMQHNTKLACCKPRSVTTRTIMVCIALAAICLISSHVSQTKQSRPMQLAGTSTALEGIHYQVDPENSNLIDWLPVASCVLPPPPPFYLKTSESFAQIIVVAVLFGAVNVVAGEERAYLHEWLITWGCASLQIANALVSLLATAVNFFRQGPWHSTWNAYECAATMAIAGPWLDSLFMACLQVKITQCRLLHSLRWIGNNKTEAWCTGKGAVIERKLCLLRVWCGVLLTFFGIPLMAVVITHIVPGLVGFSLVTVPIISAGLGASHCLGALRIRDQFDAEGIDGKILKQEKEQAVVRLRQAGEVLNKVNMENKSAEAALQRAIAEKQVAEVASKKAEEKNDEAFMEATRGASGYHAHRHSEDMASKEASKALLQAKEKAALAASEAQQTAIVAELKASRAREAADTAYKKERVANEAATAAAHAEELAKEESVRFQYALIHLAPGVLATTVAIEISFFATTYVYGGMTWKEAITATLMERQIAVYACNFLPKVILHFAQFSWLFTQTF